MPIDEDFAPLMRDFDLAALDADPATIFGVWSDLRLAYTNLAWLRFAEANGAPDLADRWPIGSSIAKAISGPLSDWFSDIVTGKRALHPEGLSYSCPSAITANEFRLTAHPLHDSGRSGLLLVHSLVYQAQAIEDVPSDANGRPDDAAYRNAAGFMIECSHCRRFNPAGSPDRWDWIAEWVARPPAKVSHGLCPICASIYYS